MSWYILFTTVRVPPTLGTVNSKSTLALGNYRVWRKWKYKIFIVARVIFRQDFQ